MKMYRIRTSSNDAIGIDDALEILKYLAGMDNVMTGPNKEGIKCENAWNAGSFVIGDEPRITEALELLKYLAKMLNDNQNHKLTETWGPKL